jgi:dihydropteroate synthase
MGPSEHLAARGADRADRWQLRTRTLRFGRLPRLMGIVNVTPDSFSDGGRYLDPAAAIEHGLRLEAEGADLLDIGGQSTRPGAEPVGLDEELRRVMPVVAGLAERVGVPLSIDTSQAAVAREALRAGVEAINDVTALTADPAMLPLAAESGCGVCAMHMQGTPQTMQQAPHYDDVVGEVFDYLRERRDALEAAGVPRERIALDPGIGFGKTLEHNLALLRGIGRLHRLGCPLVVGHSRKRFIGGVLGDPEADRTAGTIGMALALARRGVEVLRVHDVAAVRHALLLFEAGGGLDQADTM